MNIVNFSACDSNGVVVQTGTVQEGNLSFYGVVGETVFPIAAELGDIIQNGVVVGKDVETARQKKCREVNQWREQQFAQPVEYNGALWDADEKSSRNLQAWASVVANGTALPDGFFWRDANNADHIVDADFVRGLASVLTLRGTSIYIESWRMKQEINSLDNADDVSAYVVGGGL